MAETGAQLKQGEIDQERVRWYAAAILLVVSTLPVTLLLASAITRTFDTQSLVISLFGSPTALYGSYLAVIVSSLLGASFLAALTRTSGDRVLVTRAGQLVLVYTGVIALLSILTLARLNTTFGEIEQQAGRQAGTQLVNYASWVLSISLTIAASLLGVKSFKSSKEQAT